MHPTKTTHLQHHLLQVRQQLAQSGQDTLGEVLAAPELEQIFLEETGRHRQRIYPPAGDTAPVYRPNPLRRASLPSGGQSAPYSACDAGPSALQPEHGPVLQGAQKTFAEVALAFVQAFRRANAKQRECAVLLAGTLSQIV